MSKNYRKIIEQGEGFAKGILSLLDGLKPLVILLDGEQEPPKKKTTKKKGKK
jgi:hypothetical protein